jgi:hypothetical protein
MLSLSWEKSCSYFCFSEFLFRSLSFCASGTVRKPLPALPFLSLKERGGSKNFFCTAIKMIKKAFESEENERELLN